MANREAFTHSFRQAQVNFSQLYALLLTANNMSLQQFTLLNILNEMGSVSMTEASKCLHVTKPAVTNLVDGLEKDGLLCRSPHPEDRRVFLLEIKPKGSRLVQKIQNEVFSLLFKGLDLLNSQQQKIVQNFYDGLVNVMGAHLKKELESR